MNFLKLFYRWNIKWKIKQCIYNSGGGIRCLLITGFSWTELRGAWTGYPKATGKKGQKLVYLEVASL